MLREEGKLNPEEEEELETLALLEAEEEETPVRLEEEEDPQDTQEELVHHQSPLHK